MVILNLINPDRLPESDEFLWRYIDIHKLLNVLTFKRIRFTRMDQFEDPLEGIPLEILEKYLYGDKGLKLNLANIILDPECRILTPQINISSRIEHILKIQSSHYISCWFYGQRESMAMWNLYSNSDGVAIKIPFGKLKENLKPNPTEINIKEYFCGRVEYQDFQNDSPYPEYELSKVGRVSLRKDVSFSHEKEIRFVIKVSKEKDGLELGIESDLLNLKEINLKVVCHPRMDGWKKENIRHLLKAVKLLNAYSESEIRLR